MVSIFIMLPIYEVIDEIKESLRTSNRIIIEAPPGAGKTTVIPLELMNEKWCDKKIIMLEPRRIAVRNAAYRMAGNLKEKVGEQVGYRVHLDRKVSKNTRVEVVTEGLFLNKLLQDPELSDTSLVILDEFHERSQDSDLSLALLKEVQEILRDDLKIAVMSATLNARKIEGFLENAPVIKSEGRTFPVEIINKDDEFKSVIVDVLNEQSGSVLVFLPGVGEIKQIADYLTERVDKDTLITPLYGNLSKDEQDRAVSPSPAGKRKIVLATTIAESSITIEGVRVVIDSGLIREPQYNPKTGMDSLETFFISKDSADQRAGRAGRTEPGICYRVWEKHKMLESHREPSILTQDVTSLVLSLFRWGTKELNGIEWLTPPSESNYKSAVDLLTKLGAIDSGGITEKGHKMALLPLHPRLAAMFIEAKKMNIEGEGALLAALLSEKDILHYPKESFQCDISLRIDALNRLKNPTVRRVKEYASSISKNITCSKDNSGTLLLYAYPDRVGKNMGNGRFYMSNGQEVLVNEWDSIYHEPFAVIPSSGGLGKVKRVFLGCRISEDEVYKELGERVYKSNRVEFDKSKNKFKAFNDIKLGHLILKSTRVNKIESEEFKTLLSDYLKSEGLSSLNWSIDLIKFRDRVNFINSVNSGILPDLNPDSLQKDLNWLFPYLSGLNINNSLNEIPLADAVKGLFTWDQQQELEKLAPTHLKVPSGSNIPIDYSTGEPVLKVRLQELFGLIETPCVNYGKSPITIHLLSPASRPIQITRDLKSFWDNTYIEVKKDLKGRYSKHYWPEDPLTATPTNRTKKKK